MQPLQDMGDLPPGVPPLEPKKTRTVAQLTQLKGALCANLFLAVLQAGKLREDESGLLFPIMSKSNKRDTYPWYELVLAAAAQNAQPTGVSHLDRAAV